jgi:NAD-dependent SIR2 family protein deacetylase
MMSLSKHLPLKYECPRCHRLYMKSYQLSESNYPNCPKCQKPGLLLGLIELEDIKQHPLRFTRALLKNPWHKPST